MDIFPLVSMATGTSIPTDRTIDGQDILPLLQVWFCILPVRVFLRGLDIFSGEATLSKLV